MRNQRPRYSGGRPETRSLEGSLHGVSERMLVRWQAAICCGPASNSKS